MLNPVQTLSTAAAWFLLAAAPLAAQPPAYATQPPTTAPTTPPQGVVRRLPAADVATASVAQPPFQLTREQQAQVDQVLQLWELESDKIKTYKCSFVRREFDPVFLNGGDQTPIAISQGYVSYLSPDKGRFKITEIERYNAQTQKYEKQAGDPNEHWVCTGEAVFEYDAPNKQLKKYEIPPELQGKGITDGPLPFLFGAKADKLRRRYYIRITQRSDKDIWLDVRPKFQADAANYSKVEIILDKSTFLPSALLVYAPNAPLGTFDKGPRTMYVLGKATVNSRLDSMLPFQRPRTPPFWKLVVEEAPQPGPAGAAVRP